MGAKIGRALIVVALLVSSGAGLIKWFGARQANKFVDEGNALIDEGNNCSNEGVAAYKLIFTEENIKGFPGNREQLEPHVKKTEEMLNKSAAKFREAISKFESAGKEAVNGYVVDYWKVKSDELGKLAETKEALRDVALLIRDKKIENIDQLNTELVKATDRVKQASSSADALSKKANEIQSNHPDEFK